MQYAWTLTSIDKGVGSASICDGAMFKVSFNSQVMCSFLQVYQEKVYDLLNPRFIVDLPVREHPKKGMRVFSLKLSFTRTLHRWWVAFNATGWLVFCTWKHPSCLLFAVVFQLSNGWIVLFSRSLSSGRLPKAVELCSGQAYPTTGTMFRMKLDEVSK